MPPPLTKKEVKRRITIIEKYLRKGYPPYNYRRKPDDPEYAVHAAARELDIGDESLKKHAYPGRTFERQFGLSVNWSLFKAPPSPPKTEKQEDPPVPAARYRSLELQCRRLENEARLREASINAYKDEIIRLEDWASLIDGVKSGFKPPRIKKYKRKKKEKGGHTVQLHISDVHLGAKFGKYELNGLNSFSVEICRTRMRRLTDSTLELLTEHTNVEFDEMVIVLGGDLISGGMFLHEETARTDELQPTEQVQVVAEILTEVIGTLKKELGIPFRIICVPGNHGRTTRKNEPSQMIANSLDIMACKFIESAFSDEKDITFEYAAEAIYNIYRWIIFTSHGHMMGSGGGGGVYGPTYTMTRGGFKTFINYVFRHVRAHYAFIGHYHQTLKPLPWVYSNGSVVGPDPYSQTQLKAIPEPAKQNLFIFHERRGIVDWREIQLGDPEEGSIYTPDAPHFFWDQEAI